MKVTYYGQSCVEFDFDGTSVLLDPFISYNELAKDIKIENINPDFIFLSHCHQDHVADLSVIQQNSGATVAAIVETAAWVRKQGVPDDKVIEYNFGGDRKSTRLNSSHVKISYAVFCLKKKKD